jgi:hypothetical protein
MRERRLRHRSVLVAVVAAAGCGGSNGAQPPGTSGVATTTVTVAASDLAPTQLTASTVARPATPPACDPGLLAWAAEPGTDASTAAVLTVTNAGGEWCEVDVSASQGVDPLMEPDVWLEAGASALLVVGEGGAGCDSATEVTSIELDVNGRVTRIDLPAAACAPVLLAFYPA